jgi:hypothetical protein
MKRTLILGYGNFDRQDDGVAWHVLASVASRLGCAVPLLPEDEFPSNDGAPDFFFELQLTPELAETIALYDRVCFVDAHTGAVPQDVNVSAIVPGFQASPLTAQLAEEAAGKIVEWVKTSPPNPLS